MVFPPDSIAAVCAIVSIPSARPLTTGTPRSARILANFVARLRPSADGCREPTMATAERRGGSRDPPPCTAVEARIALQRRSVAPTARRGSIGRTSQPVGASVSSSTRDRRRLIVIPPWTSSPSSLRIEHLAARGRICHRWVLRASSTAHGWPSSPKLLDHWDRLHSGQPPLKVGH
jgi:hypothetical protein